MMQTLFIALLSFVAVVAVAIGLLALWTSPERLSRFANDPGRHFSPDAVSLESFTETVNGFARMTKALDGMSEGERLKLQRQGVEGLAAMKQFANTFIPVDDDGVRGEWVLPTHGKIARKVLYIHGGFFVMGSPNTHRPVTSRIAEDCDCAVFSLDYSLQPENPRMKMVHECRRAYRWLAAAKVPGEGHASDIVIMGDSAGGNLALATSRWATRQPNLRRPASVVAHSPTTDATLSSLTLSNRNDDLLVSPALAPLLKIPNVVWRLAALAKFRVRLNDPDISPLFGALSGLPRTLLLASGSEIMLGDSIRYANKARSQGSDIVLQIWDGLPHAWLALDIASQTTEECFAEIARFVKGSCES